ncbi:MAG TPA: YtxH domain-containing protein [Candidatus Obscuribacterales bacterium]
MSSRFFEGLLVGGLLGYLFGILSAPKSGADLRRQLADSSEDLYRQASDSLVELRHKTGQAVHEIQHKGEEAIRKASATVQEKKEQLASKLDEITGQGAKVLVEDQESAPGV